MAKFVEDPDQPGNQVLRVLHPEGAVGPGNGSGIQMEIDLIPQDRYWFSFRVRFGDDFVWRAGGKLPGLAGGTAPTGGQNVTGDGWSARNMWFGGGKFAPYIYHVDQAGMYGDTLGGTESFGPRSRFTAGQWHHVAGYVQLNTDSNRDGTYKLYLNGLEIKDREDLRYRTEGRADINKVLFVTFFGGQSDDYQPVKDEYIFFDDFRVSQNVDFIFEKLPGGAPHSSFVNGLPGDFDGNGSVDGKDFLVWQRGGSPMGTHAADMASWQLHFGASMLPLAAANLAVPEPGVLALFAPLMMLHLLHRRDHAS